MPFEHNQRTFGLLISTAHGMDHFLKRLFPPLVPILGLAFGYSLWKIGLILGAWAFGTALGQAPAGIVADKYDRRYLLSAGVGVSSAMICCFALVPLLGGSPRLVLDGWIDVELQFVAMLAVMFVGGLGSSTLHPAGYPLITANVDANRKGAILGLWGSASKFGEALGPAIIGVGLIVSTWENVVFLVGVVGLVYAGAIFVALRNYDTLPVRADSDDENDPNDVALSEIDRRLYLYPMLSIFAFFVIWVIAIGGLGAFVPEFVNDVYGYSFSVFGYVVASESTASFYFTVMLIAAALVQLATGVLTDRYDARKTIIGFTLVTVGLLLVLAYVTLSPLVLVLVFVALGASLWGLSPARDALISDVAPVAREGRTFGYLWTGAMVAEGVSPVVIGLVGDLSGLRTAFAIIAAVLFLSTIPIALLFSDRIYRADLDAPHPSGQ